MEKSNQKKQLTAEQEEIRVALCRGDVRTISKMMKRDGIKNAAYATCMATKNGYRSNNEFWIVAKKLLLNRKRQLDKIFKKNSVNSVNSSYASIKNKNAAKAAA